MPHMCLIWQHELRQHILIAGYRPRVLMLHDGPFINVERSDEDILYMALT